MKKKILIGSLLVLTLLLLMPSIPAIQQKTIEDKAYSDLVEKFGDVDADFIELLKDVDLEDLQEKVEIFVNSETFKHFNSSESVQTLLNNNYDFESKIKSTDILTAIILFICCLIFIFGLITWLPVIIFSIIIEIPTILWYTIASTLYNFPWNFNPIIFIEDLIGSFIYGVANWLAIFFVAIIWPFYLVNYFLNYSPYANR